MKRGNRKREEGAKASKRVDSSASDQDDGPGPSSRPVRARRSRGTELTRMKVLMMVMSPILSVLCVTEGTTK